MTLTFSPEQITALAAAFDPPKVRQREQIRSSVSSLEGWQVITGAHHISGFDELAARNRRPPLRLSRQASRSPAPS